MKDWKYYCSVLGVRENATAKDIRHAYRHLALERHPDKHNNSTRSKEDFQLLHEAYQYLLDALANDTHPAPPPRDPPVDREAPTSPGLRRPAIRRHTPPVREPSAGRAAWKMWLYTIAVGLIFFSASTWWELAQNHNGSPIKMPSRDLASHSWCLISKVGAETSQEAFEYWSEMDCKQKCALLAKSINVNCSWNGVGFHGAPKSAPTAPALPRAAEQAPQISCQITMERQAGITESTPYLQQTEASCTVTCLSKADLEPRAGIKCLANDKELFHRDRFVAEPEHEVRTASAEPPLKQPQEPITTNRLRNTCFLTAIAPGNFIQEQFPGDTAETCESRCRSIIMEQPLEREVRCAFAGKEIVTYIPDSTAAYLARNPEAAPEGIRQGAETVANCEVYASASNVRLKAFTALQTARKCEERCHEEFTKANHGFTISCIHGGKGFFRKDAP